MEFIIPWRLACPALRLRKGFLALAVVLAAILISAPGSFADDLPNQEEIEKAETGLAAAEAKARENIPDSPQVKAAEDALGASSRYARDIGGG